VNKAMNLHDEIDVSGKAKDLHDKLDENDEKRQEENLHDENVMSEQVRTYRNLVSIVMTCL